MVVSWRKPSDINEDETYENKVLVLVEITYIYIEIREGYIYNENGKYIFQDPNGNKIDVLAWSEYPEYPSWID